MLYSSLLYIYNLYRNFMFSYNLSLAKNYNGVNFKVLSTRFLFRVDTVYMQMLINHKV